MTHPTRLLFLEVDAGDRVLIRRWAADGTLPTFRGLLERGLVADTLAPEGFFVGGIWPTLQTGVNPARHGIHSLVQLAPGTYDFQRWVTGERIAREPFWNFLSRAGRRVAVLDVPLSGLSRDLNGIQCVEWGSHDANCGFQAWPPEFEKDLVTRFGRHPLDRICNDYGRTPEDFVALRDRLIEGVRRKTALTRHYLRQGDWDFFGQVFTEGHCVGHQCWHLHDASHPGHDPTVVAKTGDPIREVYAAIDAGIGEVLSEVGDDTHAIVLAGHRMSHKFGAQFMLPELLVALGVAVAPEERAPDAVDGADETLARVWRLLPARARDLLGPARDRLRRWVDGRHLGLPPSVASLDVGRSRCFLMDNGYPVSGLRVNLAGREPRGLIAPEELGDFCDELERKLLELTYADTGERVVARVKRTRDLYEGEHRDLLPDLLVEWDESRPLGSAGCGSPRGSHLRIASPRFGEIEGTNGYCRTGDHRPEGMLIATGPGIAPGRIERVTPLEDVAPTLTALLGVELPDVDGRPIAEIAGR